MFSLLCLLLILKLDTSMGESCYKYKVTMTKFEEPTSVRNNSKVTNCSNTTICGSILQIKNGSVEYMEDCLDSQICANTSDVPQCPKKSCYIFCCQDDLCNRFNLTYIIPHVPEEVWKVFISANSSRPNINFGIIVAWVAFSTFL